MRKFCNSFLSLNLISENVSTDRFGADDDSDATRRVARRDLRRRQIPVFAGSRPARRRQDQLDRQRRSADRIRVRRRTGQNRKRIGTRFAERHQEVRGPLRLRRRNRLRRRQHDVPVVGVWRVADVHLDRKRRPRFGRKQRDGFVSSQRFAAAKDFLVSPILR